MQASNIMRFMQLNGILTGGPSGSHWFRLPGHSLVTVNNVLGYRLSSRGGPRIASTVPGHGALRKPVGNPPHASTRAAQ